MMTLSFAEASRKGIQTVTELSAIAAPIRLYAIVLRMVVIRPGAVPTDHGGQARACLLDLIRRADKTLSAQWHDTNIHKPYTISLLQPLEHTQRGADGALHCGEGDRLDWRFSLQCEPGFEAVLKRFLLSRALPHLRVGTLEFAITDVFASNSGHFASGYTTPAALLERYDCPPATLDRAIELHFTAPTVFHLGRDAETGISRYCTLPQPRLLFSTLRKKWASLGGYEPGDVFDSWVERAVNAESYRLNTTTVVVDKRHLHGFSGFVRFRLQAEPQWWPLVHLLADLAFWTGVGYQTTRGMGQVRRIVE